MCLNKVSSKIGYVVKMFPRLSETFILNEILELERQGIEVVIFSLKKPNEGKFHPQLSDLKARVFYLDDLDTKKWVSWLGKIWPQLAPNRDEFWSLFDKALSTKDAKMMEYVLWSAWVGAKAIELGVGHFHAHFASLPSTIAYFSGRLSSIPFSFTAHAKDIYVYDMEEHLLREKLHKAEFVVTVTNYNREYLLGHNPDLDKDTIKVIYNGVMIDKLKPPHDIKREHNVILGVGRLVPKKGFDSLLNACRLLKDNGASFKCLIAGDGSEAENLYSLQKKLELDDTVEFLGPKTQDEIINLMYKATLMCLPCTVAEDGNQDALPTVLLEALACGLPVISTNISGIPEIIDSNVNGILVGPDNPNDLFIEISRLLSSEKLRIGFANAGYKKAIEFFDITKNVGELRTLFVRSANNEPIKGTSKITISKTKNE